MQDNQYIEPYRQRKYEEKIIRRIPQTGEGVRNKRGATHDQGAPQGNLSPLEKGVFDEPRIGPVRDRQIRHWTAGFIDESIRRDQDPPEEPQRQHQKKRWQQEVRSGMSSDRVSHCSIQAPMPIQLITDPFACIINYVIRVLL